MKSIAILSSIFVAFTAPSQSAADHNNWKLTIEAHAPRSLVIHTKGTTPKTVMCVLFDVKNETGAGRTITPFIQLTTDTKQTVAAGYNPAAHELLKLHGKSDLADLYELAGGIEDGATKKCLAVFEGVDPLANHYTFHFQGFASPLHRAGKDFNQQTVVYRGTFWRIGNEYQVCSSKVVNESSEWATIDSKKIR
ncbi:MAG: hypothetical protein ACKVS6_12170 [Planctomycetota bacterium]